ncbi:MAG TPA: hypothetical protein VEF89_14000 [Solirubrobacteraceae bacterium]|nr:hypothetical protein [Solirubrobacteraceae bacterium]
MAAGGTQSELELKASLGDVLDCSTPPPAGLDDVARLGGDARLDAALIRRILIDGKLGSPPAVQNGRARRRLLSTRRPAVHPAEAEPTITVDPKGIQIRGARIYGELNLDGLPSDTKIGVRLTKCLLEHPLTLCDGGLPWLELDSCVLPAIVADRAQIGMMAVRGCRLIGMCPRERLSLNRAHVSGDLLLDGTCVVRLTRQSAGPGPATVDLQGAKVDGRLSLERTIVGCYPTRTCRPTSALGEVPSNLGVDGAGAAVCLSGATVAGPLVLCGAALSSSSGPALLADHLTVTGDAFLDTSGDRHFSATGAGKRGAVCLIGASIAGQLSLNGARLTNKTGPALLADLLSVKGPTLLEDRFYADGSVSLWGAALTGRLSMKDATIETAAAADEKEPGSAAAVWLSSATLSSSLIVRGATLTSDHGPALMADYMTVKNDAFLCEDKDSHFKATGACALGTVCLAGASITGQLSLCGSTLKNTLAPIDHHAPALLVDEANIQGDVLIDEAFSASAETGFVAVSMINTTIGKRLRCRLEQIEGRPCLDLRELTVTTFTLNLGGLNLDEKLPPEHPLLRLDGLKYTQMPTLTHAGDPPDELSASAKRKRWKALLKQAEWAPQPYEG